ncbi:hypothetical protein Tco_1219636 [Tanacetum coccineum]
MPALWSLFMPIAPAVASSVGMTEAKDSEVCKITRADGSSSFHGDIEALELLRWKLHEYSGVYSLFLDGTSIHINMLVEKKYPLKKEILKKMINLKIEAEEDSNMASELIKFIKSQIAEQNQILRGLASVEERRVFYKKNEVIFTDQIAVLKSDASFNEAEKLKKEKEDNLLKINNYDNATKSLDKVIGSQLVDNNKKGLGYNVVPPLPTGLFAPPIIDLSKEPEFEGYGVKDWVSDDKEQDESKPKSEKKTVIPTVKKKEFVKAKQDDKAVRNTLGNEFAMNNKACFACESFNHLIKDCKRKVQKPIWNNARRVNHHNSHRMSYPHPKRNFVPKAVLMKTGIRPVNVVKPKAAYNAVKRNRFNVVKALACWVWMPKNRVVDHVSKNICASVTLKRLDYIDAQGRFKSVMAWVPIRR